MTEAERMREPGFYWVKELPTSPWEVAQLDEGVWWRTGAEIYFRGQPFHTIGPRITPPQEEAHER